MSTTATTTSASPASATHPVSAAQRIEELGRIIMAYSEVTEKLQVSHERLERTVLALREELSEKNRLLERKNRLAALGEMAAGMAHEIRNPLGGIQLYAGLLGKDVAGMPASELLVRKISNGVKRLELLVSQVLQFTREIAVNVRNADMADVIDNAVDLAAPQAQAKQVVCKIHCPRPMPVNVDPVLIEQALLNLLLNAIEAMDRPGEIRIECRAIAAEEDARRFSLIVRDQGPGIPPAILDRIFNPFFTTKDTGTGLGLAIVHRVVDAHDGTIHASNPPDGGAQFEIRI